MPGPVLISSNSGSGHPQDEALLAAALRMLERGSWGTARALTQDPGISGRAHPHVDFYEDEALQSALSGCRLLMVVGDLRAPAPRRRAALHILQAKAARVPIALVSVRLGNICEADTQEQGILRVLSQAESITTCDSESASTMARCMNRRVPTTAPLELVLSAKAPQHSDRGIALENEYLQELTTAERESILQSVAAFASDHGLRATIVCTQQPPGYPIPQIMECAAVATWTQWMRALTQVRICVARPESIALHLAVAQGAIPVTHAGTGAVHLSERIGLHGFSAGMCAQSWHGLLKHALQLRMDEVAARSAPLRVVAWRALGSLSEAVRGRALNLHEDDLLRSAANVLLTAHWDALLDAGRFHLVEQQLESWRELEGDAGWAGARARSLTLQGQDQAARVVLEELLTREPGNAACLRLLAMVLWRQGDSTGAQRCWQHIMDAGGDAAAAALEQWQALRTWANVEKLAIDLQSDEAQRDPAVADGGAAAQVAPTQRRWPA